MKRSIFLCIIIFLVCVGGLFFLGNKSFGFEKEFRKFAKKNRCQYAYTIKGDSVALENSMVLKCLEDTQDYVVAQAAYRRSQNWGRFTPVLFFGALISLIIGGASVASRKKR